MNTKKITVFVLMVMVLSANAFSISIENGQEKEKVTTIATFDGYDEDDGYAFLINEDPNDEDSEETVYFSEITEQALKAVNLKAKDLVGKRFEISYEITEHEEEDENGYIEVYETYKIISIKKL
ncbi:hypothetical protein [Winogradskyella helgolandensis]|uniref:hypothetical protein n=1 Tax=Winogradskyella helgolandensis TaxID=2697010 RepID=UPI0015B96568|nr:hypothetical protein [Winogradskyella helgolandensis]